MAMVSRGNGQLPLLYIDLEQTTVEGYGNVTTHYSPTNLQVSADGGNTWTFAPTRGFPTAQPGNLLKSPGSPLGVLSDGSVLFLSRTLQDVDSFYTWKRGETSWHRLRPDFNTVSSVFVLPGAKNTVCLVTGFQSNYSVHMLSM